MCNKHSRSDHTVQRIQRQLEQLQVKQWAQSYWPCFSTSLIISFLSSVYLDHAHVKLSQLVALFTVLSLPGGVVTFFSPPPPLFLPLFLFVRPSVYLSVRLSPPLVSCLCFSICLSLPLTVCPFVYVSACLSVSLSFSLPPNPYPRVAGHNSKISTLRLNHPGNTNIGLYALFAE